MSAWIAFGCAAVLALAAQPEPQGTEAAGPQPPQVADSEDPEALWNAGQRQAAIERLVALSEAAPSDAELRLRLVRAELTVHRYNAALEHAEPLGPAARAERARALFHLARYAEAIPLLDPDRADEALMAVDAREALGRFDGPDGADATVDRAIAALGPDRADVLVLVAQRHVRHDRLGEAIDSFRSALELDPINRAAMFGLGRALVQNGEPDEGRVVLERHRTLIPLLDQLDEARRTIDMAPQHGPNHAGLGDIERALGRHDEAERAYRRALECTEGTQRVPVGLRLARLLREDRSNLEAAIGVLNALAEEAEAQKDPRPAVRAGDYLMDAGRPLEALQQYNRAERMLPNDPAIQERAQRARSAAELR